MSEPKYVNLDTVSIAWLSIWTVLGATPVPIFWILTTAAPYWPQLPQLVEYDRNNCSHMTADRCNWFSKYYVRPMLCLWDTNNETVYSTWNDLQRSLKIIGDVTYFLLVVCSNHAFILYRFRDKARYWLKIAIFSYSILCNKPWRKRLCIFTQFFHNRARSLA